MSTAKVAEAAARLPRISLPGKVHTPAPRGLTLYVLLAGTIASAFGMLVVEDEMAIGAWGLALMMFMIFLKIPIAFSLIVPGLLGMFALRGMRLVSSIMSSAPYGEIASWSLSVIPMFVLMGMLLSATGLTGNLFRAAQQWLWWMPGNLAVGTNVAGAGLAAVSGSTIGVTYALGRVSIPEMIRAGYDRRLAILAVMAAGLPGQLIPPSILMIIYAGMVETPIGPQLLAGVVPGVLIAVIFCLIFIGVALVMKKGGGEASPRQPIGTMLKTLLSAWPVPILVVVIIGGMLSGFFTATEVGAVAALLALVLAVMEVSKKRDWKVLTQAIYETVNTTGMIFLMMLGATIFSEMLAQTGMSGAFAEWASNAGFDRVTFLLVLVVVYLVLGTGMDTLAMMALTVPVLMPALEALDISLIWFGVFVVLLGELAVLSPPVGVLTFVIHSIAQDPKVNLGTNISLKDVFVAVLWIMPGALVMLVLLIFWPEIATFLPDLMARNGGGG